MQIHRALILTAIFAIYGCASIPLSTALRLSSLSPNALAQIDPAQVRVKVSVPLGYEINVHTTRLTLALTGPSGSRSAVMSLAVLGVANGERSRGLFRSSVHVSTYMLVLDPEGVQKLRELEHFALSGNAKSFEFSLQAFIAKMPFGAQEVTLWAALRLHADTPFISLIDGATLKFGSTKSGS